MSALRTDYHVTIADCSKDLTTKERIMLKDTTDAIRLDEATQTENVIISPEMTAVLDVHNEKSENKDYRVYIIVDKTGQKYITGSQSFWNSYCDIADEMADDDTEEWTIRVYRMPSKNRPGKDFITCSIM